MRPCDIAEQRTLWEMLRHDFESGWRDEFEDTTGKKVKLIA